MKVSVPRNVVIAFTALVFAAGGYGVSQAIHSPLFLVQVVEVADQPQEAPMDAAAITQLAAVPVGQVNLFDLDLRSIEKRLLSNSWIREARLQKRFPQTLSIAVEFREPTALMQSEDGTLAYVDRDGKVFGQATLMYRADLPVLTGMHHDEEHHVPGAVKIVTSWDRSPVGRQSQLSSLQWDHERGYRALVTYPLKAAGSAHTWVDLGQEVDAPVADTQLSRLSQVLRYLSQNSIAARQIWADAGKKIVVKTAHGS